MHYIMRVSSAHNNILVIKGDQGGTALRKHHLDQEGKNVETSSKKQSVGGGKTECFRQQLQRRCLEYLAKGIHGACRKDAEKWGK